MRGNVIKLAQKAEPMPPTKWPAASLNPEWSQLRTRTTDQGQHLGDPLESTGIHWNQVESFPAALVNKSILSSQLKA